MVVGSHVPFVEKIHVAGIGHIQLRLFVDYAVDAFEVAGVVVLVVEVGVVAGVGRSVVVECFLHKEELYSIAILIIYQHLFWGKRRKKVNGCGREGKEG